MPCLVVFFVTSSSTAKDVSATPVTPPVVLSKGKVSLADHLDLRQLPLATTPGGTNFCMKALHPSEHTIKTARVPGGNDMSVSIASDMVFTIPIADADSRVEIIQGANPVILASVNVLKPNGGGFVTAATYAFTNAAFGGAVHTHLTELDTADAAVPFRERVDRYRVVSQSVTAELIAPALSDQGTIIAYQYGPKRQTAQASTYGNGGASCYVHPDWWSYELPPSDAQACLGTKAYTSKARDGYYQPLKLTSFKWRDATDVVIYDEAQSNLFGYADRTVAANHSIEFPYFCDRSGSTSFNDYLPLPKYCSAIFGIGVFNGIAANTAVRLRVRQVVEVTAKPGSVYAPMLESALPPDPTSLKMYAEISARMADAYPASYNDLGRLKDLIMGIGKKVLPYVEPALDLLSNSPGLVGTIARGAKAVAPVVRDVVTAVKAKKKAKSSGANTNVMSPKDAALMKYVNMNGSK